jgi:hypothetical protein
MAVGFSGAQAPGVYRLKVGAFEITVLSDGNLPLETKLFSGDLARAEKMLEDSFLPKEATSTSVNEWLINTGDKLVLVDAGTSNVFAVNSDEYAYWMSDEVRARAPDEFKPFFDLARAAIKPYADAGKVQMYREGARFLPGLTAIEAPGHTVGHSMVRVSSAGSDFLIWGDIVHNAVLQFPEPDRSIAFDNDPAMAIATRKRVLDMVATDRLLFGGAHLPFPGLGHAAKTTSGYTYVPLPYAEYI